VLLPASVGGVLANLAVTLAGKIPVNLNFTAGPESMSHAIKQCGIGTILTSKVVLKKASLGEMEGVGFVVDILKQMEPAAMAATLALVFITPAWLLNRLLFSDLPGADRTAAIIFSSGSTGVPKGVVLTHRNILSNIDGVSQVFRITTDDVALGILPF